MEGGDRRNYERQNRQESSETQSKVLSNYVQGAFSPRSFPSMVRGIAVHVESLHLLCFLKSLRP